MTPAALEVGGRRKSVSSARAFALLAIVVVFSTSCGDVVRQGTGGSFLIVSSMEAAPGSEPTEFGNTLLSDVITVVDDVPTFFNDVGRVTFRLGLKDPGSPTSPTTPGQNDAITINRYHVRFFRADGRNVPGVDVPYEFDGAFTLTVSGGDASAGPNAGARRIRHAGGLARRDGAFRSGGTLRPPRRARCAESGPDASAGYSHCAVS